jgi:hypothetical protein
LAYFSYVDQQTTFKNTGSFVGRESDTTGTARKRSGGEFEQSGTTGKGAKTPEHE